MDHNLDPSHFADDPRQGNTYLEMEDSNKLPQQGKSKRKNKNKMQEDEESQPPTTQKKTKLSDEETDFLELQQRYHQLLAIPPKDRSAEQKDEYNRLKPKYSRQKTKFSHLVEKRPSRPCLLYTSPSPRDS